MVQRFAALFGGKNKNFDIFYHLMLAGKVFERKWSQGLFYFLFLGTEPLCISL